MNRRYLLLIIILFYQTVKSQNFTIDALVVDKTSKKPLSFVSIYNISDNSISNSEGLFSFTSTLNEINFSIIGYSPVKTSFDLIKKNDTIFMEAKAILLEEVVVSNLEPFIKKVYENLSQNLTLSPYTNDFFLRSILRKNDEIVQFQDVSGIMTSNSMLKKTIDKKEIKYGIEILNMRKIGIVEKKDALSYKQPDFQDLFSTPIYLDANYFDLLEEHSEDDNYCKISFTAKNKNSDVQKISGYAIINKKDYAITQYFVTFFDDPDNAPYKEMSEKRFKSKTKKYQKTLNFSKNSSVGKYYLNNLKLESQLEVVDDKKENPTYYALSMDYFVTKSFTNETIKSNFTVDKDIFKAKFSYSDAYWEKQNQLPLTIELKKFIDKASRSKESKKEFEIIGNF